MNRCGFEFDSGTNARVQRLTESGRLPHAVIIESQSPEQAEQLADFFTAYTVCEAAEKPCGECRQCRHALAHTHADVLILEPETKSKTGIYSIEQIRALAVDAQIRPNDADAKVYIFREADKRLPEVQQNAFLKLLEEPPQRVFFFLLTQSAQALLPTIRSRCTVLRMGGEGAVSETALEKAKAIVAGIISPREYDLLTALRVLADKKTDKKLQAEILDAVKLLLRDAMVLLSGGSVQTDRELAGKAAAKLTRKKILEMLELTDSCGYRIRQNTNINLLTTWLCGEYRRILWQR
ncbi:MAG: hypothetical protein IJ598_07750 [Ruminococcus sp.]|nr:hypothetical protein [Ruminococcus sp.]